MSWDVHFVNGYSQRLQIAIAFYDTSCTEAGRPWGTRGWWQINPGDSEYVLDTNNRYFYYYAEALDGSRLWTSEGPFYPVLPRAFTSCAGIGATDARDVGMVKLDLHINNWWRLE
jgi:hypothetical protein